MTEKDEHPRPEEPRQFTQRPCRLDPPGPSQDLLERARVGWERFIGSIDD
ncbi:MULTISPECIES: hypothetical protein [Streptomyces]|uniref:Uncharacterized protein n=1 Tax=Streptomyces virginiae TaxID=1961 RepID=A0ABQ3NT45_STRVG|nr:MULTISPECIES: hypothetical protein [Streptomyces]MBP2345649.1 hypothetical protein [Streptomyces virginiae]GHI15936.1 hypothetical protein Scinn_53990 [Streptomyces virginiae]GLV89244.1 hypothetical protein Slala04_06980 [Streptomyces lavendulae subsp. lavendulae]